MKLVLGSIALIRSFIIFFNMNKTVGLYGRTFKIRLNIEKNIKQRFFEFMRKITIELLLINSYRKSEIPVCIYL